MTTSPAPLIARPPLAAAQLFDLGQTDARWLAAMAYVWGMPYVAAAQLRQRRTLPDDPFVWPGDRSPGAPLNRLGRQRLPSDPSYRAGVGISTDTMYASAWLDLDGEPQVLEVPAVPNRYYAFQVANANTSTEHVVGRRTHGDQLPPIVVLGPRHLDVPLPEGTLALAAQTRYVNLPGRFLVDPWNPRDLQEVRRIQDVLRLRPLSAFLEDAPADEDPPPAQRQLPDHDPEDPLAFLARLGTVLLDEHVPAEERAIVDHLAAIGLSSRGGFDAPAEAHLRRALAAGLEDGRRLVAWKAQHLGRQHDGWTWNPQGPRFGTDHLLRAGVAKDQIYITLPEDGLYPVCRTDGDGQPLSGQHAYRLRFPAGGLPPVGAFWSVTLYDDEGHLVTNPLRRQAIGDRTPGLRRDDDGGLTIDIHHRALADQCNWLPAPAGRFYLMMRLFLPGTAARDGTWTPPPVLRIDD